ncbi:MAG: hypothetical protein E7373_06990 [Clostridiales bacterium]|nr:hypothetical protein [Clostridiales bacterium]
MAEQVKSLKQYCKEAKKRLKQGFWQNYHKNLTNEIARAEQNGISSSKIKEYYAIKVSGDIKNTKDEFDAFYVKVKKMLDEEGEVSNAIGRLTDKEYFETLSYEEKQRYSLILSEKYLKAVERYKKEKEIGV